MVTPGPGGARDPPSADTMVPGVDQPSSTGLQPAPTGAAPPPPALEPEAAPEAGRPAALWRRLARWWAGTGGAAAGAASVRVVVGVVVSELALRLFAFRGFPAAPVAHPTASLTGGFFNWDAGVFYRLIALHGYPKSLPAASSFFPLYPLLGRGVGFALGSYERGALAVSWVALGFAAVGVMRLTAAVFPASRPLRSSWLLCWFPASVFLIAGYPESLFLALTTWTLVFLLRGRPWLAGVCAGLAGLARPEGAVLGLAVMIWVLLPGRPRRWRVVPLAAVAESGFGAFSLYQWIHYGDPLEVLKVQHDLWHRDTTWPFHTLVWSLGQIVGGHVTGPGGLAPGAGATEAALLLDDAAIVAVAATLVVLAVVGRRRRDFLWLVVPSALVFVAIVSNGPSGLSPEAAVRYVMSLPAIYLLPGLIRRDATWTALLVTVAALGILFQVTYNLGGWFT